MIEINGKHQSAKVFTDDIDEESISQMVNLLDQIAFKDSVIRIMPDVHSGKGCVIGFTANLGELIIPNLIGVDIGCGMYTVNLGKVDIDFKSLDYFIRKEIPFGQSVNDKMPKEISIEKEIKRISDITGSSFERNMKSIGSLGGGNHFIEVAQDNDGFKYLVIHSGSRNFGLQIAKHHQKVAEERLEKDIINENFYMNVMMRGLARKGQTEDIEDAIKDFKENSNTLQLPKDLAFLRGEEKDDYLKDMMVAIEFAILSREMMASKIINHIKAEPLDSFTTIHNYVDDTGMIRKGAISARKGEKVLIPINMRDGSIIAVGKGNSSWNNSAPHGAGRLFSRSKAKKELSLDNFKETMQGIYSTSVSEKTLDEAPDAYKPMESILKNIEETVDVIKIIKPIYNFKG